MLAQFTFGIWCVISVSLYVAVYCSRRLGVAYEYDNWIFREMTFIRGRNTWLHSGYMFCVSTFVALDVFHTFLTLRRRVLSPFGLNGEVCPVDASGCSLALRSSHLEN